jgi:hypothetical protein
MNCYCEQTEKDKNRRYNKICENQVAPIRYKIWLYSYVLTALTIVINFVGTTILAQLGKFEGHYNLEAYYVSDASKMTLFTILNTAILQIFSDLVDTLKNP